METVPEFGKVINLNIKDIRLDKRNFRIDHDEISSDEEIIEKLFDEEKIIEMAEDIVTANGLNPHENLLAVIENGKKIVIEGNRRLLAINCILDNSIVPEKYRAKFQRVVGTSSQDLLSKLSKVNVVFFATREEAKPYIASKHSGESTLQWGLISQWRRDKYEYDTQGKDLDKTIEVLKIGREKIINSIKWFNIVQYGRGLGYWDDEHLRLEISQNRLEGTRMSRALEFKSITNALGIVFDEKYEVRYIQEMTKEKFDFVLFKFLKSSLLDVDVDRIDTRTPTVTILDLISKWKSEYDSAHPIPTTPAPLPPNTIQTTVGGDQPTSPPRTTSTAHPPGKGARTAQGRRLGSEKYLKNLKRHLKVTDPRIVRLVEELSTINYTKNPIASLLLIRSLLEQVLLFKIREKGKESDLRKQYNREPRLDDIVKFAITNKNDLFSDPTIADPLQYVQQSGGHRKFLNDVVHDSWVDPQTAHAELISGDLRNFFVAILKGCV